MRNKALIWLYILMTTPFAMANVTLPSFFLDNMVLQRNTIVSIWGWGNPNEEITLTTGWDQKEYKVKTGNQANWKVSFATPEAGGPHTIAIKGYNEIVLKNILIGEVWLCSGQSNMEMSASWGIKDGEQETAAATDSNIRFFTVAKHSATTPQDNLLGAWEPCSPETMKHFSAVGYYFAKRLRKELKNVPIGLICSAWGGTPAEIWMPEHVVQSDPLLREAAQKINPEQWGPEQPGRAFNAMIHPLVGFCMAGVLWYQGERNVGASNYDKTLAALIASWRQQWKQDFPFYIVQIAPFNYGNNGEAAAVIREAQRKVAMGVGNSGLVVTSDVATVDDIHPKDKKPVGERLAGLALKNTYNIETGVVNGPTFREIKIEKDKVAVYFDNSEGLYVKDKMPTQFEIAGVDNIFYAADAKIKNKAVWLHSDKVKQPVKVRYGWSNTALASLFNGAGLPASTFSSE
ncbi:MAG: sialate O-acetylesterase [Flavobacterium sp. BFFFF1]|uniref:sialate O-acetylesterase n=1 Tax=Flavobacterium sp. BFFFF1 TaxID=2015557 RepID=UPI000BC6E3FE|nr:sialate O-acetylesterase [Flavobacterium sp. BFFFF1]OYU82076.1 MAG: sialate O-acetylesterase [Flavobacterium sp. BFFFF1]